MFNSGWHLPLAAWTLVTWGSYEPFVKLGRRGMPIILDERFRHEINATNASRTEP